MSYIENTLPSYVKDSLPISPSPTPKIIYTILLNFHKGQNIESFPNLCPRKTKNRMNSYS